MDRKQPHLERSETERAKIEKLRSELEGRATSKRETKPFVAHGGKPPAPPKK